MNLITSVGLVVVYNKLIRKFYKYLHANVLNCDDIVASLAEKIHFSIRFNH